MDIALHVPGEILAAQAEAPDAYAAYDAAAHKLFAQVKKHKSRMRDHHKDDDSMAENAKSA
jgi:putative sigma-54 modulation protein